MSASVLYAGTGKLDIPLREVCGVWQPPRAPTCALRRPRHLPELDLYGVKMHKCAEKKKLTQEISAM